MQFKILATQFSGVRISPLVDFVVEDQLNAENTPLGAYYVINP